MSTTERKPKEAPEQSGRKGKPRPPPSPFYIPLNITLYLFLVSNGLAALYAPIQDCDETFNFWEPTHYLSHGYGLQTWEYSPEYRIRSWLYVTLHTIIGKAGSLFSRSKSAEFYIIRLFLALVCAASQTRLYSAICRTLSPRIGLMFLVIAAFSPGMFHASSAYIPSSFTMYTSMLGLASFLDRRGGQKTAQGIMWFGIGAVVGWPFSGALIGPLLLEEIIVGWTSGSMGSVIRSIIDGTLRCLLVAATETAVTSAFFQRFAFVPWNIVAYNVFGGQDRGPDIFGTEPWTFYIRNLLLNFNVWFIMAMLAAPFLVLQALFRSKATSQRTPLRSLTLVAPFYLWLGIFTVQPHKEERFMYPAYPFLALNAAITMHLILIFLSSTNPKEIVGRVPVEIRLALVSALAIFAVNVGILRIIGMVTAYNAPLKVIEALGKQEVSNVAQTVCFGKEWYRFPSSYLLPENMRAKFIRSEFDGLLPGEFPEAKGYLDRVKGASLIPTGMNDLNQEDPEKYVDISQCSFLVDSYFPSSMATELEPHYILNEAHWKKVSCQKFLDVSQTNLLGRLIWIPKLPFLPDRFQRKWGEYCLFERQRHLLIIDTSVEWIPSDFKRPAAAAFPDWNVHTTKPIPYRPFRYGPKYFVTMGLRSLKWDEWIELDNHYLKYHADKARRIEERGSKCSNTAPEAMEGAIELLEELSAYLPERYPSMFTKTAVGMDNTVTGESFNIVQRPLAEDPMQMAGRMVQDDLALMFEKSDGEYYLLAGSVLLAGFWRLEDKYGMRLSEIHTSGDVPQYKEKLEKGMMNFFRRLKPDDPMLRNNYFIQVDESLPWSYSIGSEDAAEVSWSTAEKNKAIEHHYFRSERQSLRRLPRSGAVLFTIRTYFEPITEIVKEPYVPGRLASAVRSWGDDVSRYKGKEKYEEVLLEYLDKKHQEQVAAGLKLEEEDEVRKYPL
ncbi:hypothetical protein ASPZODRAFT_149450 [Penicilliopsis zonata CBS 506.65]|uniref:Mannosyltransferase n=1 Tax=Penicilliopsis zonata CBS 506.65 TaxID=1073090 RepID=A0A1L9SSD2_9EURO|nr:hypothetical protein ASPZODRAFT_149450 [Penicilliopsis zonata CBS 506.65]OJJ50011.1 hypothetical protein ASPZODRAFT_149450 [Penicilliopsis zonata CBS 506.65]